MKAQKSMHRPLLRFRGLTRGTMFGLFSVLTIFLIRIAAAASQAQSPWDPSNPADAPGAGQWPQMETKPPHGSSEISEQAAKQAPDMQVALEWQTVLRKLDPDDQALLLDSIAEKVAAEKAAAAKAEAAKAAAQAADQEHAQAVKTWEQLSLFRRMINPQPERKKPKAPAPGPPLPMPERIESYRDAIARFAVRAISAVIRHFQPELDPERRSRIPDLTPPAPDRRNRDRGMQR